MALPIIIAGAGAAGLLAALRLSSAGFSVTILEADLRPGGRIHTRQGNGFSGPVESGAEFIHGDLPLTFSLLEAAGIEAVPAGGQMMRIKGGKRVNEVHFMENWDELMEKMGALAADMPLAIFLQQYFPGDQYAEMRSTVQRFAEGYDLADLETASTLALHQEWNEEEQQQYRVKGGYGRLIRYLVDQCIAQGCDLHLSAPVREVRWAQGRVDVLCGGGGAFTGSKLIITAPLGVLQQGAVPPFEPDPKAYALRFEPAIPHYLQAARQLGYGSVIKIIIEFKTTFWEAGIGFIISDEAVPTWWTQGPDKTPLLTGWLTAKAMKDFRVLDEGARIRRCLTSLAAIFACPVHFLEEQLVAMQVNDWSTVPYVAGGYSFETVHSSAARKLLRQPLADTVYFSGEALYEGNFPATVEAAFCAGQETAEQIIGEKIIAQS